MSAEIKVSLNFEKIRLYCILYNVENWMEVPQCSNCKYHTFSPIEVAQYPPLWYYSSVDLKMPRFSSIHSHIVRILTITNLMNLFLLVAISGNPEKCDII